MKKLYSQLLQITSIRTVLIRYHYWRLDVASKLMKKHGSNKQMPVWCSERFRRHQRELLRLGFLVEQAFELNNRTISGPEPYRAFNKLITARFPHGCWSCAASGRRVIVTAPPSQFAEWEQLISTFDLSMV